MLYSLRADFARIALIAAMLLAAAPPVVAAPPEGSPFVRDVYPLSKPIPTPDVRIDVSAAPEARAWAEQAQSLVRDWFPYVAQMLATNDYEPPQTLTLIFKPGIGPPAYATGDAITIKAEWIAQHPEDFGMVIHEMTHIIQRYPGGEAKKPGWLVEGIADYIRWWRYEPEAARTPINVEKASYRDSYRTTAWFLAWITGKYNRALVFQLDRALRNRAYSDDRFREATGKSLDALWSEFLTALPTFPPRRPAVAPANVPAANRTNPQEKP